MSLLRQLFRQKIGKYLSEDLEEIFFPFLLSVKHPPKNLLQDIKMLWFLPGDSSDGGGCVLECLEGSQYVHSVEDYAENYNHNCDLRRAMAPLRSVKYLENELEEYRHISERDYSVVSEAISEYPEHTAVDIVNIIRRVRNGELDVAITENWDFSENTDLYEIDTTTLIIYREECTLNDKWKNNIENFLDEHMFPKYNQFNNQYGFIWLASDEKEIYGRLILKQERDMNNNYWNRVGADDFYF
tara:strand:+ start:1439 stop:2167 length:729 start_codon:yes stop_codon:yes gene_type:complete